MYYYFYKITNNINNKFYYGVHRTENLDDGYMGSGHRLLSAYKKYGKSNFTKTIIKYFDNNEDMYAYEKQIVTTDLVNDPNCYNLKTGGSDYYIYSDETRKKISDTSKGRTPWNKGKTYKYSEETLERMRKGNKGKNISKSLKGHIPWNKCKKGVYSDETIQKMRDSHKGKKIGFTPKGYKWINNGIKNKYVKKEEVNNYIENSWQLGRQTQPQ